MRYVYTSKKGRKYYLGYHLDKKGNRNYFLSREEKGEPAEKIPDGYKIFEDTSGQVHLRFAGLSHNKVKGKTPSKIQKIALLAKNKIRSEESKINKVKQAKRKIKKKELKEHQQDQKISSNEIKESLPVGMKKCPVCKRNFPFEKIRKHIQKEHPHYTPSAAIAATAKKSPLKTFSRKIRPAIKGEQIVSGKRGVLYSEPFICGWCSQQIYRVWRPNGKDRYYEDKELTQKHYCIRPANWGPDR